MGDYILDQGREDELDRLIALQEIHDPVTTRHLDRLGVGPGSRCLEIGAGAGSVACWMSDRAGPTGSVVAVDLDPRFLADHGRSNLEVRQMDLRTEDLGEAVFDVAHARAVLEHISERGQILRDIVRSLRPGGWVLIEDMHLDEASLQGFLPYTRPAEHSDLFARVWRALALLLAGAGADTTYAARLPDALLEAGLVDVGASAHTAFLPGGVQRHFMEISIRAVRPMLLEHNLLPETDIGQMLELLGKSGTSTPFPPLISAWGRKPA